MNMSQLFLNVVVRRAHIVELLRDQGMLQIHLDTVFDALIMPVSRLKTFLFCKSFPP